MLTQPTISNLPTYLTFATPLTKDHTHCSYPLFLDGIQTEEDFRKKLEKGFTDEDTRAYVFEDEGKMKGYLQFFVIPEDKYMQVDVFCVEEKTGKALDEFIQLARRDFPGYELYMGFPKENTEAVEWLEGHGIERIDESYNNTLDMGAYAPAETVGNVVRITEGNFDLFEAVHTQTPEDMYWTAGRIREDLENWTVFTYCKDGKTEGAIYYMNGDVLSEIFGLDIPGEYDRSILEVLLKSALNEAKRAGVNHMMFFGGDQEEEAILACGFTCVGQYVCYKEVL